MSRDPDLAYRPVADGVDWPAERGATTCLVVGTIDDDLARALAKAFDDCRASTDADRRMAALVHDGTYAVKRGPDWHTIIVRGGRAGRASDEASSRSIEDSHLTNASFLWDSAWPSASALAAGAQFEVGAYVRDAGTSRIGRVKSSRRVDPHISYTVTFDGQDSVLLEDALTLVTGDPSDPTFWLTESPATAEQLAMTLTWTKLSHPLTDTLYSFASSKTIFRPYQFKPVLKLLASSTGRMLIADEVGLGKTIEAGLIWNELDQRTPIRRALVVVPSNLVQKWRSELHRRFDRKLPVLKGDDLLEFARQMNSGEDPPLVGIISLESLRVAREAIAQLTELHPPFDLVIVDEAHNLRNRGTANHAIGSLLADWADNLLFLSATPINLGTGDLFNLVSLLDEDHFVDQAIFDDQVKPNGILNAAARALSSGQPDARKTALRELRTMNATPFGRTISALPAYGYLCDLLEQGALNPETIARTRRYIADLNTLSSVLTRTRKADVPDAKALRVPVTVEVEWTVEEREFYTRVYDFYTRRGGLFGAQMPLRQAASCIPALKERLREQAGLTALDDGVDDVDEIDGVIGGDLDLTGISLVPLAVDTKFERLLSELRKARNSGLRQVMIFSFFRKTLAYLERRLREEFTVGVMHGGVPMDERQKIMDHFRAGDFEILLLSEVGSEGLDFEFCNVLVNYDLPWNPMRVEQRIGRIDRFGQKHPKIFIYNMRVPGTIEERIFGRLYDRIRIFEESIGDLEPILREDLAKITRTLLNTRLTQKELNAEVERVAVALEKKRSDIQDLEEARGVLGGVDSLLIDGLTEDGPAGGRFIGSPELRRMLLAVFARHGGNLKPSGNSGLESLTGTTGLASAMRRADLPHGGSQHSLGRFCSWISDGTPIAVTFDPQSASQHDVDLITARHPLIRFALVDLQSAKLDLRRFGRFSVSGLPAGTKWVARFDLASSGGLRPRVELWTTAINVGSGLIDRALGDTIFDALAHGTFGATEDAIPDHLENYWQLLDDDLVRRTHEEQLRRREENTALVSARIEAQRSSYGLKIRRTQQTIADLRAAGQQQAIVRMHEGRLRAMSQRQDEAVAQFDTLRPLTLKREPVAVAVVTGR